MIRVHPRTEYAAFDSEVRVPGTKFLQDNPTPSSREFRRHAYWRRAKSKLRDTYRHCAYTSRRIRGDGVSVDHFRPKVKYPKLAYEWDNYRLARPKLNRSKADSEDLVDPFHVRDGWFELDCPSCLVRPGQQLQGDTRRDVLSTIGVLQLNSNELAAERCRWLVDMGKQLISFGYVKREYPFLAFEIERQGLRHKLRTVFAL